jgi:hypothetical protein
MTLPEIGWDEVLNFTVDDIQKLQYVLPHLVKAAANTIHNRVLNVRNWSTLEETRKEQCLAHIRYLRSSFRTDSAADSIRDLLHQRDCMPGSTPIDGQALYQKLL